MKLARYALLGLVAFVLAACAVPLGAENPETDCRPGAGCYTDLAAIPFAKVGLPSETTFTIDRTSPVFTFPGIGPSHFAAYELPQVGGPYRVRLRSYVSLYWFYYPIITFLDARKSVIAMTDPLRLSYGASTFTDEPLRGDRLDVDLNISPADGVRYIIVHTADELIRSGPAGAIQVAKLVAGKGGFAIQGRIWARSGPGLAEGDLKLLLLPPPVIARP